VRRVLFATLLLGCAAEQAPARPPVVARPAGSASSGAAPVLGSEARKKAARAMFRSAMRSLENGDYEHGITALHLAYELVPHANVAYNLARAYAESRAFRRAIQWYRVYLESKPTDAREVEIVIESIERHLETCRGMPC